MSRCEPAPVACSRHLYKTERGESLGSRRMLRPCRSCVRCILPVVAYFREDVASFVGPVRHQCFRNERASMSKTTAKITRTSVRHHHGGRGRSSTILYSAKNDPRSCNHSPMSTRPKRDASRPSCRTRCGMDDAAAKKSPAILPRRATRLQDFSSGRRITRLRSRAGSKP